MASSTIDPGQNNAGTFKSQKNFVIDLWPLAWPIWKRFFGNNSTQSDRIRECLRSTIIFLKGAWNEVSFVKNQKSIIKINFVKLSIFSNTKILFLFSDGHPFWNTIYQIEIFKRAQTAPNERLKPIFLDFSAKSDRFDDSSHLVIIISKGAKNYVSFAANVKRIF